jgi:hypothetical protein
MKDIKFRILLIKYRNYMIKYRILILWEFHIVNILIFINKKLIFLTIKPFNLPKFIHLDSKIIKYPIYPKKLPQHLSPSKNKTLSSPIPINTPPP